jgi:hypothetical protein
MCFVFFSEQIATFSLCNIDRLFFRTDIESVYGAVRTGFLKQFTLHCKGLKKVGMLTLQLTTHNYPTVQGYVTCAIQKHC